MSTYRVPKCGRHFVKNDDVTIYPVLVVARTVLKKVYFQHYYFHAYRLYLALLHVLIGDTSLWSLFIF